MDERLTLILEGKASFGEIKQAIANTQEQLAALNEQARRTSTSLAQAGEGNPYIARYQRIIQETSQEISGLTNQLNQLHSVMARVSGISAPAIPSMGMSHAQAQARITQLEEQIAASYSASSRTGIEWTGSPGYVARRTIDEGRQEKRRQELGAEAGSLRQESAAGSIVKSGEISYSPHGADALQAAAVARAYNTQLERQIALTHQAREAAEQYRATIARLQSQTLQSTYVSDTSSVLVEQQARRNIREGITTQPSSVAYTERQHAEEVAAAEQKIRDEIGRTVQAQNRAELEKIRLRNLASSSIHQSVIEETKAASIIPETGVRTAAIENQTLAGVIGQVTGVSHSASTTQQDLEAAFSRTSRSARSAGGAMRAFHRDAVGAGSGVNILREILRDVTVELGEMFRHARGQQISSIFSAFRRVGGMAGRGSRAHEEEEGVPEEARTPRGMGGFASIAAVSAPVAVALLATELIHITSQFAKLAEETRNSAAAAGISVEQYSLLAKTFELAGIGSERLATAMGTTQQSIQSAMNDPLGPKGTAFERILGPDYLSQLPSLLENPLQAIEKLREKYQELKSTLGAGEALGVFRTALGRTEFQNLAPILEMTAEAYKKLQDSAKETHAPMTRAEVEKLEEVRQATERLTEAFEGLGKEITLLAGNSGFIDWLEKLVIKLDRLVADGPKFANVLKGMAAGAVVGAAAGTVAGPAGVVATGVAGAIAGGFIAGETEQGRRRVQAAQAAHVGYAIDPMSGQEVFVGVPEGWEPPATQPGTGIIPEGIRAAERESEEVATPTLPAVQPIPAPTPELGAEFQQLYGKGHPDARALITEAEQYRQMIEQTTRVEQEQLEVQKAKAEIAPGTETSRRAAVLAIEKQILAVREAATQREKTEVIGQYQERAKREGIDSTEFERDLRGHVGVTVESEGLSTQRQAAELEKRQRDEAYRAYEAQIRDKVAAAQGDYQTQISLLSQLLDRAKQVYGEDGVQFSQVHREMEQISHQATEKFIQDKMREADAETSVLTRQASANQMMREIQELQSGGGSKPDRTAGLQQELAEVQSIAQQQEQVYADLANLAGASTQERIQALDKEAAVAEQAGQKEIEIAKRVAEEQKRQAEEAAKAFTELFDKIGSNVSSLLDGLLSGKKGALKEFFQGLEKDILHTGEALLSQLAAKQLGKMTGTKVEPGEGLGGVLGTLVSGFLGLGTEDKKETQDQIISQAAQIAEQQRSTMMSTLEQIKTILAQQEGKTKAVQDTVQSSAGAGTSAGTGTSLSGAVPMTGPYADTIRADASIYGVPPQLAYNLFRAESGMDPNAVSATGAQGLGQLMPSTAKAMGVNDPFNPEQNISGSLRYLSQLHDQLGSWEKALSAYNRGPEGAAKSGYSLSGYSGSAAGQDLIASARMAGAAGPSSSGPWAAPAYGSGISTSAMATADQGMNALLDKGIRPPGYPPDAAVGNGLTHVNIAAIGGSTVSSTQGSLPVSPLNTAGIQGLPGSPSGPSVSPPYKDPTYGFASGGQAGMPSPPNSSDTLLAWLTPGEFVVKKDTVEHYGTDFLHSINSKSIPKFQSGGKAPHGFWFDSQYQYQSQTTEPSKTVMGLEGTPIIKASETLPNVTTPRWDQYGGDLSVSGPNIDTSPTYGAGFSLFSPMIANLPGLGPGNALMPSSWNMGTGPAQMPNIPAFQHGGTAIASPVHTAAFPGTYGGGYAGVATASGITTEFRGFSGVNLQTTYPTPKFPWLALGLGAGLLLAAMLSGDDKDKKLAAKLLKAKESGPSATETTSPLDSSATSSLSDEQVTGLSDSISGMALGGEVDRSPTYSEFARSRVSGMPQFQSGGWANPRFGLSHDEIPAILQSGERVLNREETRNYSSLPHFHTGGYIFPSFAEGGDTGQSIDIPTASPSVSSGSGDSQTQGVLTSISSLSSSMSGLVSTVSKVAGGFTALERATAPAAQAQQGFLGELKTITSTISSVGSAFKSIMGLFGGGGEGGGLGGIFSIFTSLFALDQGGIIPSAAGGMVVGGLPGFARGGQLSILHPNEMVLPAHISQFVQDMANQRSNSSAPAGDTHNHQWNVHGVLDGPGFDRLLMSRASTIGRAFQKSSRNFMDLPG